MTRPWKIGYGVIGWLSPMTKVARQLHELDIEGIEGFGLTELLPEDQKLKTALDELGMQYVGSYFSGSFVQPDRLKIELNEFRQTVEATVALGGKLLIVGGGRDFRNDPEKQTVDPHHWRSLCETAEEMGRICHFSGAQLAFHPHQGTLVYHPDQVRRFAADTNPDLVRFTFDTAHLKAGGCDVLCFFQEFEGRVAHVHLKDLQVEEKKQDFVALGRGNAVPLKEVITHLWKSRYSGWLTIELDATSDALENAKYSLRHLDEITAQVMNETPRLNL